MLQIAHGMRKDPFTTGKTLLSELWVLVASYRPPGIQVRTMYTRMLQYSQGFIQGFELGGGTGW